MKLAIGIYFSLLIAYSIFHAGRLYELKTNPPLVIIKTRTVPLYVFPEEESSSWETYPKLFIQFKLDSSFDNARILSATCSTSIVDLSTVPRDTASLTCYDEPDSPSHH